MANPLENRPPGALRGSGLRRYVLRSTAVLAAAGLAFAFSGAPTASAHYLQPPGDLDAAPAVVHVQITFNYVITLHDMDRHVIQPYGKAIPGPSGVGVIFNQAGQVMTTTAIAFPDSTGARTRAINEAFAAYYSLRWTPAELSTRKVLRDPHMNEVLQDCYRGGGGHCSVVDKGRRRTIALDTVPRRLIPVTGRETVGEDLTILTTAKDSTWSSESIPTVGLLQSIPADAKFTALGYDSAGNLTRTAGVLEAGAPTSADALQIANRYENGGDGVVLVAPSSKGDVLAIVVRAASKGSRLVSPAKPVGDGGYRAERGVLDPSIDEALGYFGARHYTHSATLLAVVTKALAHRELLVSLTKARELSGTPADVSEAGMNHTGNTGGSSGIPWGYLAAGLGALGVIGTVAGLLLRRRRQARTPAVDGTEEPVPGDDLGEDPDFFADDAATPEAEFVGAAAIGSAGQPSARGGSVTNLIQLSNVEGTQASHFCPGCGASLLAGDRFCYHCGTPARQNDRA